MCRLGLFAPNLAKAYPKQLFGIELLTSKKGNIQHASVELFPSKKALFTWPLPSRVQWSFCPPRRQSLPGLCRLKYHRSFDLKEGQYLPVHCRVRSHRAHDLQEGNIYLASAESGPAELLTSPSNSSMVEIMFFNSSRLILPLPSTSYILDNLETCHLLVKFYRGIFSF